MQHETRQHLKTCNTKQQEKMTVERRRFLCLLSLLLVVLLLVVLWWYRYVSYPPRCISGSMSIHSLEVADVEEALHNILAPFHRPPAFHPASR
jgi:hypothetical protein